jgi:hypothetical protein
MMLGGRLPIFALLVSSFTMLLWAQQQPPDLPEDVSQLKM